MHHPAWLSSTVFAVGGEGRLLAFYDATSGALTASLAARGRRDGRRARRRGDGRRRDGGVRRRGAVPLMPSGGVMALLNGTGVTGAARPSGSPKSYGLPRSPQRPTFRGPK